MKRLFYRVIPLFLLAVSPAALALEVRFLAWDEQVAARPIAVPGGQGESAIKGLHPLQRSEGLEVIPAAGAIMLRALDRQDAAGKPVDFAVKMPGDLTRPLVLLLPDSKAAGGLRGHAIEDDSDSFSWGTFRFINATGKSLEVTFGTTRKPLPPGWQPVDLRPGGESALPVSLSATESPKTPLYTGVWKPENEVRRLVFVVPGTEPRLGPLALKVILEDRRALAAAAAP